MLLALALGLSFAAAQQPAQQTRVSGSVIALNGEPVRRATMRLQGQPPINLTVATDDEGRFVFENVTPGRYTLSAEKAGFITQRYGARSNTTAGTPLLLTAGQELKDLSVQLSPQGIISGHVSDADGDPAPNSLVQLQHYTYTRGRRQLSSIGGSQTNDQGDFRIANLAPGRYYLYARNNRVLTTRSSRASGQEVNVQTYYPNALEPAEATPLDVVAGGDIRGVTIQLRS
ncbi:MAG: carboxypeptidase regulatory-like domain-containing protein [Bryobacteraceae bacterium]